MSYVRELDCVGHTGKSSIIYTFAQYKVNELTSKSCSILMCFESYIKLLL